MISIIVPVNNEEENLPVLQKEIVETLDSFGREYEIVYVDDGSQDNSLTVLKGIVDDYSQTTIIRLTAHFGQTEAMQAGIDSAKGDVLVFLDADLQNDPKDIPKLLEKIDQGYDIVSGWRKDRRDAFLTKKLPSYIANSLISRLSGVKLRDYGCTLKAYRRDVFKKIRLYGEMHRFIPLYAARIGASIAEVEVMHHKRIAGNSKYNLARFPKVILDFLVAKFINSYLSKPMYIFGLWGVVLIFVGILIGFLIILRKIFFGGVWVSPLLFLLVALIVIGFQCILMGLLAEICIRLYYSRAHVYTYGIKEIITFKRKNNGKKT